MLPRAHIVHRLRGRLRLRIREKPDTPDYFQTLCEAVESIAGVSEVSCRESTGSILLYYPELTFEELAPRLHELRLFELVDGPEPKTSPSSPLFEGVSWMNNAISEGRIGKLDLNSLVFFSLVGLAARQLYRGHIVGPAVPMLVSAFTLAKQIGQAGEAPDTDDSDADD